MKELLQKLTGTYGPSGSEETIRATIREEIAGLVDEVRTDALGNLIGVRRGGGRGLKVMLAAHMDEIGVIVTHIDEKGFLRFQPLGGVFPLNLNGGRVVFANGVTGAFGLEKLESNKDIPDLDKFFIDVGATSKASAPVKIGDSAGFTRPFVGSGRPLHRQVDGQPLGLRGADRDAAAAEGLAPRGVRRLHRAGGAGPARGADLHFRRRSGPGAGDRRDRHGRYARSPDDGRFAGRRRRDQGQGLGHVDPPGGQGAADPDGRAPRKSRTSWRSSTAARPTRWPCRRRRAGYRPARCRFRAATCTRRRRWWTRTTWRRTFACSWRFSAGRSSWTHRTPPVDAGRSRLLPRLRLSPCDGHPATVTLRGCESIQKCDPKASSGSIS